MQCDPYYCSEALEPVEEVLDHQTDTQLSRHYAQTAYNVYELTDELAAELIRAAEGSGSVFTGNWVPAKTVLINGEVVVYFKFKGSHVKVSPACKSVT